MHRPAVFRSSGKISNDDLNDADGYKFLMSAFKNFYSAMAKDASIYVFYATAKARIFHDTYEETGFKIIEKIFNLLE